MGLVSALVWPVRRSVFMPVPVLYALLAAVNKLIGTACTDEVWNKCTVSEEVRQQPVLPSWCVIL